MTDTTSTQTALEIVRDAYIASDVDGLRYRLDGDQVTALLEVGAEFFAISEEYSDGEIDGYSWAWGERTDLDSATFGNADYFGQDGGATESEARQAVAEWLARFAR